MQTLTLTLPDSVEIDKTEVMMLIAARLYDRAVLSLGQAAELAGKSKREFAESLGGYGGSIFNHTASDIERDVKKANGAKNSASTASRTERFEQLRGSLKDDQFGTLSLEDFKAERRDIWKGLTD